ncbi:MAG: hypothetical protein ABI128_16200 [Rhodanobacter sp.]
MKTKDQDMAKRGANNPRQEQEATASRDRPKQRDAGSKEAQEKDSKQKKPDQ